MAKEKTKEQIAAEEAARESEKLVPITIRFTKGAMDVIDEVARKNKMSKAEVVRIACDNRLIEYLSQVIYVDEEQGDAVRKELYNIGESLSKIRLELNKIGVNYNQEVKLKNIKQKYGGKTDNMYMLKRMLKEEDEVKAGETAFTTNQFKKVMEDFAKISNNISSKIAALTS